MSGDTPPNSGPDRRIALLIDADNVSHAKIELILAELSKYGTANIRRAYGDWGSDGLRGWKRKLLDFAIRPMQQINYSAGKNATDIALVIDAMELLYTQELDAFCIASSDADFTPLAIQLRANGHEVYGFGERKTPDPFVNACTTFLYLDSLDDDILAPQAKPTKAPAKADKVAKATNEMKGVSPAKANASDKVIAANKVRPIDEKILVVLRGAVEAASRDDGWAVLSNAGSHAKRQAPIDPRNYGVKNFSKLFELTGLFDIVRGEGGHFYIADRENTDRASVPGR